MSPDDPGKSVNPKGNDVETTELTAARSPRPRPRAATPTAPTSEEPEKAPVETADDTLDDTLENVLEEPTAEPKTPVRRPKKSSAPPAGHRLPIARLLIMLLVVALAGSAYAGHGWWKQQQLENAHTEAVTAARQLAVNFVSISAATVDADLARIAAGATGEFGDEFGRGMPGVREAVLTNKVQSVGTVLRAGLVSGDDDSAIVLVAIDATVSNVKAPDGRVSHYRMQLDLAKDDASGKWLVSKLQFVG
ncbi:MAG: hypothetical protein HOU81_03595 [Hamadaea sp.]|uniref:hypothetical protein n=1 Tax=Hamadaea sp. TaxID=2024425 RepID=UPI0017E2D413|nr:hypothetical protein [Hamadaea sp.]NUR69881.1 hypothetical protein [Hamadaea sp.]NUT22077.1 hypothetical protein [Hamadaea sp.]